MSELLYRLDSRLGRYPPPGYHLDDYKRWFPRTADVFLGYLKRWKPLPVPGVQDRPRVGVLVVPWLSTATPWYSIMLAIGLARRGRSVVLVWDDSGFPEQHVDEQNRAIGRVLDHVARDLAVVRVSAAAPHPAGEGDALLIDQLTEQNVAWRLRGARPTESDLPVVRDVAASLRRSLPLVRSALERADIECLVVPGGVYGTSGLFRFAAGERDRRVATFDADLGVAQVCVSGVAAQGQDLPRAYAELWQAGHDERADAIAVARTEFERRTDSSDRYGFQAVPARAAGPDGAGDGGVLIPLNVEWDTAALGKHVHFESTEDWLTSTITTALEEGRGPITVRQHPSERRKLQAGRLDLGAILSDRFGGEERCRFVAADDPVNTYDLLASARLVLPFVSTIGIEAAALGKPVLVAGTCYYEDLGFVWSASSRDEYLSLVRRGVRGELEELPDQVERAWTCYYLAAVRNRVWTHFTAQPDDFWTWCQRRPDDLFGDPDVAVILEAIDRDVPVSLLRHHATISAGSA